MTPCPNVFGDFLKALRESKGLTRRQAELKGNLKPHIMYQIEERYKAIPTLRTLVRLAKIYDVSVIVLVKKVIESLEED